MIDFLNLANVSTFLLLGLGDKCSISIDGPPSALVADTDTTYLIFGGAAVLLILLLITGSIVMCRRMSVGKYDTNNVNMNRVPEMRAPTGTVTLPMAPSGPLMGSSGPPSSANTDLSLKRPPSSNTDRLSNNNGFVNGLHRTEPPIEPVYATSSKDRPNYDVWDMEQPQPPPPPMYRRMLPPAGGLPHQQGLHSGLPQLPQQQHHHPPPTHMMTLDRRVPGGNGLQHHLVPNGCDLTLNRRHFSSAAPHVAESQRVRARRADELWLV